MRLLNERLLLFGRVVLSVFANVALQARLADGARGFDAVDRFQTMELDLELFCAGFSQGNRAHKGLELESSALLTAYRSQFTFHKKTKPAEFALGGLNALTGLLYYNFFQKCLQRIWG